VILPTRCVWIAIAVMLADVSRPAHIQVMKPAQAQNRMANPLSRVATRAAYGASQLGRVAWYVGHREIMRWLVEEARRRSGETARPRPPTRGAVPVPDRWRLYADMAELFRLDLTNIESGIYPLPADHDGSWPTLIARSRLFFQDLPQVHQRRQRGERREVLTAETRGRRPEYYLQNFHFQSGGWMTEDSARRYDTQVEVLFNGSANAIRRQALPPLSEVFAGRDQRTLRLIDVGCGTGRFLEFVKQVWPRLPVIGMDMSEAYIAEARSHLQRRGWIRLVVGKGEAIPVADQSQDAVTSIFVFHELPPDIRRAAFREFARVLKPGGRLVIIDSLQLGDEPDYDGMLELFPRSFHEPYYASYIREDFSAVARASGLRHRRDVRAYVSKVMVFDKLVASQRLVR
jgi:ubiquinone/menaquinone biosynthesis C-methylase UbiE